MSNAVKLATWIRNNKEKKGTPDFETVSAALKKVIAEENAVSVDPTDDMSTGQKFAAGAGKALTDLARGAGQFIPGLVSEEDVAASKKRDAPLMGTSAGVAGNVAGSIAAALPSAMVPGANTYTGAAALGATYGALNPTSEGGIKEKGKNALLGAALGATVKGGMDGAGWLGRKAKDSILPYLSPARAAGSALDNAAGSRRADVIKALKAADGRFAPTAGQAATPAGSAEFSALQKIAEQVDPSKYAAIADDQSARMMAPISRIGGRTMSGGGDDLTRAVRTRGRNASWLYPKGKAEISPKLKEMMSQKLIKPSVKKADKIAEAAGYSKDSIEYLQVLKEQVDDVISKAPKNEAARTRGFRDRLIKEIGDNNPQWDAARQVYSEDSLPINQMKVGRELESALKPALNDFSDDALATRPGVLANALRKAPQTIKRATGDARYRGIDEILNPSDVADIQAVAKNLASGAKFNRLARAGMSEANSALENVKPGQLPGVLERGVVIANSILGRTGKRSGEKIVKYLAQHMDDPKKIASIMESASPDEASAIKAVLSHLKNSMPAAAATLVEE